MDNQYIQRLGKIEAVIDTWLPETPGVSWLEKVFGHSGIPISKSAMAAPELVSSLIRPGRDLVKRGGKRWRPLLMVLAAECLVGERGGEAALPLVPLVEFSHNASLIHDDVEDNSDERRGKPAIHLVYGTDTAINSGTFMYFLPLACLSSWAGDNGADGAARELRDKIWILWAGYMRALHLGQAMDIAWHRDYHSLPTLDEYDRMCRLKTGCLARLAAVLGVYCSGLSGNLNAPAELFGEAAEQLGVGFQILDDVKNLETGVPGKKRGDDIVEGKKSLPVLLYLHRYPEKRNFAASRFAAARARGTGAPEVDELIGALENAGVLDEARAKGTEYIRESGKVFSAPGAAGFSFDPEGRELLAGLVGMISGESGHSLLENRPENRSTTPS